MSLITNKTHNQPDILTELNTFILGATQNSKSNPLDLSKTALFLLKNLPAARDAILEYFCNLFDIAVSNYIKRIETEIATGQMPETSSKEETTVAEIHTVLCNFVNLNPHAWAPVISTWSLELLGELSTKYAGRAHVSVSAGLNEILQLWMGCRSTRTLIDITTQCLTSLMNTDSETWMNALLDTSVKHSPHFDWVVAHVGSCFPNTVITRVLSCGLKDFCQYKSIETGSKAPKLVSVVGILSHLAGSHFTDIRSALLELFSWSVRPYDLLDSDVKSQKHSTVPFLLQLATMSPTLLKAMGSNIQHTLRGNIIFQLYGYVNDWCKYFTSPKNLEEVVVNLVLKTERDGIQIINLLLNYVFLLSSSSSYVDVRNLEAVVNDIKSTAHEILEHVLLEMDYLNRTQQQNVGLLNSLLVDSTSLQSLLLSPERLKYETATRIVMMIGRINSSALIKSACYLLQKSRTDEHLAMFVKIICHQIIYEKNDNYFDTTDTFAQILKQSLVEIMNKDDVFGIDDDDFINNSESQIWWNLLTILKWEKSRRIEILKNGVISQAIFNNLEDIALLLGNPRIDVKISHVIVEILHICFTDSDDNLGCSPYLIFNLTNSSVSYFFMCCNERDAPTKEKGNKLICEILEKLTNYSKAARIIALRELLERCLFKKENLYFGADMAEHNTENKTRQSLLEVNHKQSTTMMLTQRHSSIFHAGIIGSGCRKPLPPNPYTKQQINLNTEHLLRAIKSCCIITQPQQQKKTLYDLESLKKSPVSLESLTLVSLLLVQFVSPDVMYNGLPWPEEEFTKVTIERDLYIRRLFTKTPVLWEIMNFIAVYRPVLCYCSVLLRAITATLLHQWNNTGCQTNTSDSPNYNVLMETTIKLIDLMSVGQLLPPPLSNMRDVIPLLKPHEIVQLLRDCVWNYMRDHIPSPALFGCDITGLHWRDPTIARPPPLYADTLRIIMQSNIEKLGDQYAQLFYNIQADE